MSQERLAEIVGVDRSTIVRWERADTDPQPWHRPRLAAALQVDVDDLADLLADLDEPEVSVGSLSQDIRAHTKLDLVAIGQLREQVRRLDERYTATPSSLLIADATKVHAQCSVLLDNARDSRIRRELALATVESAILTGQLVWDSSQRRNYTAALRLFDQAVAAARLGHDPSAEAHAELRKCYLALYGMRSPELGRSLAHRAMAISRAESPVLTGLAALHLAEACAMLGDEKETTAALASAERQFHRNRSDDPAAVLYCPSQFGRLAGSCWLSLRQPARAERELVESRRHVAVNSKAGAVLLGNLALASTRQGHLDLAVARLHDAIDAVERTQGGGGFNVVAVAARELKPWRQVRTVQEIHDRLLGLMANDGQRT